MVDTLWRRRHSSCRDTSLSPIPSLIEYLIAQGREKNPREQSLSLLPQMSQFTEAQVARVARDAQRQARALLMGRQRHAKIELAGRRGWSWHGINGNEL